MTNTREKNETILVTGATGLAGSAVIREFIKAGHPIRALVRDPARALAWAPFPNVHIVHGDMLRPETLTQALIGVDRVLLISASDDRMVETQSAFINAAQHSSVRHIVKFSGLSAADEDSSFIFGRMHKEVESYLEASTLAWTHLRPSQFMTEYLREVPTILAQGSIFLPLDEARLVPIDVVDIAKAAYLLLTTDGHEARTYAMSGPEALSMSEVAAHLSDAVGRTIHYVNVSRAQRSEALLRARLDPFLVDALDAQVVERLKGRESTVHSETHAALGIQASTLAEFVHRNAGAFLGESGYVGLR
jgi:uncharacterized protein YbjT (DUF2867 family)